VLTLLCRRCLCCCENGTHDDHSCGDSKETRARCDNHKPPAEAV
jgi:hypothetical protein